MILYPVACDHDGFAIHIEAWERGQAVTCFGCGQELVGRLPHDGIKPTAHFAHKADTACNGETALHKATKAAILRAHATGSLPFLSWECPCCRRCRHQTDLRSLGLREEARPCAGVVSDVLGLDDLGDPHVAIEIVVTHDLEAGTLDRYRALGIHVFSLRPSWRIVGDIVRGADPLLVDHRVGLVDTTSCTGCQQVLREKIEWEDRKRRQEALLWWKAWSAAWIYVGREALHRLEDQQREAHVMNSRNELWWKAWTHVWQRIAEAIVDTWRMEWRRLWREIGDQHTRSYRWSRVWEAMWEAIGTQYEADVAERSRRLAQNKHRDRIRGEDWWMAWIRLWPDIAQRESGVRASWKPICRRCRADLTPNHECLRPPGA